MLKVYYGFRYLSGRNTTYADSGKIAGELVAFHSHALLKKWLREERLSAPCGLGGGERVHVTRSEAIKLTSMAEVNAVREEALECLVTRKIL